MQCPVAGDCIIGKKTRQLSLPRVIRQRALQAQAKIAVITLELGL